MKSDGDLRMLGTCDGLAHALIWVCNHISQIDGLYAQRIDSRHVHKRAARDAILRPLKELEAQIAKSHNETMIAYENTRTTTTQPMHDGHLLARMSDLGPT